MQRINQVVHQLDGGKVQPEDQGGGRTQDSSGTEHWKDAQHDPKSQTQGNLLGGDPLSEKSDDGPNHTVIDEPAFHDVVLSTRLESGSSDFSLKS